MELTVAQVYAVVLISVGHVMYVDGVTASEAWTREYETPHVKYLTDSGVPVEMVQELLDKPINTFI